MRCLPALVAVLVTAVALAGPAQAGQGTGLYAPFPSPSGGARAQDFVGQLGVRAKRAALARGVPVDGAADGAGPAANAASARAGVGEPTPRGLLIALVAAGALALAVVTAVALDRRKDFVADPTN